MADQEDLRRTAARVAGHVELRDVQTFKLSAELLRHPDATQALDYVFDTDPRYVFSTESQSLIVESLYTLAVRQSAEGDDEPFEVAQIEVLLGALFDLPPHRDGHEYEDGELSAFANTTGQFALYPYARQSLTDLTSRLSLPPLVLGMLKVDLENGTLD